MGFRHHERCSANVRGLPIAGARAAANLRKARCLPDVVARFSAAGEKLVGAPDRDRMKEVFLAACELVGPERTRFVDQACAGDPALREEVMSLLAHHTIEPLMTQQRPASAFAAAAEPRDPTDPLGIIGVTLEERYLIEALVGEGGFAYVYRGQQIRWQRRVAIKIFKVAGQDDEALRESFVKEGALLSELSRQTTAIVQSYDIGTCVTRDDRRLLFIALEWLDGRTLSAAVDAERAAGQGGWPLARVLELLAPVAEALAIAHRNGIAHRDVKPGNMFIVEREGRPTTKLLDFGIAKVAAEYEQGFKGTGGKVNAFTLGYAAPEQILKRHGSTGPWSDVYSLALVCVELLAGRDVGDQENTQGVLRRLGDPAVPPTPAQVGVTVAPAVEAVFARALTLQADQRYPDAAAFWQALVGAARGDAAQAGPARWKLAAGLGAAAAMAAVAAWLPAR
jgi:hypothetical protein